MVSRRSTRDFLDTPVPESVISELLADGLTAPSWSNTRPYMVAVATGQLKDDISKDLLTHFSSLVDLRYGSWSQKLRALVSGLPFPRTDFYLPLTNPSDIQPRRIRLAKALYGHLGIAREDIRGREAEIGRNFAFFGAPVVLFVFARSRMGVYSPLDAGFFLENLALSAEERGLGTCIQGFLAAWSAPIRKRFQVPRGYKLLVGVSLGYASDHPINQFVPPGTEPSVIRIPPRQ